EQPEPQLYQLLVRALNYLDTKEPSMRALLHFERELATILGIMHEKREAHRSLREALGSLPSTREELIARLDGNS
ncbi:MAG: DNA repair protein RecO C-terminal domain-containing protein, partial [Luteolibacter sp.]